MPLRQYQDVTLAAKDAAAYTLCLGPHKKLKLILTAILLKFHIIILT